MLLLIWPLSTKCHLTHPCKWVCSACMQFYEGFKRLQVLWSHTKKFASDCVDIFLQVFANRWGFLVFCIPCLITKCVDKVNVLPDWGVVIMWVLCGHHVAQILSCSPILTQFWCTLCLPCPQWHHSICISCWQGCLCAPSLCTWSQSHKESKQIVLVTPCASTVQVPICFESILLNFL